MKDQVSNRLYPDLRKLEERILAALRPWRCAPARVAQLIGDGWLTSGLNCGVPA